MTIEHRFIDYKKGGKYYNGKSPGYDMDDIFHAIQSAIKDEQSKLKPQYKKDKPGEAQETLANYYLAENCPNNGQLNL